MPIPQGMTIEQMERAFLAGMLRGAHSADYDEWVRVGRGMKSAAFSTQVHAAMHAAICSIIERCDLVTDANVAHEAGLEIASVRAVWGYEHVLLRDFDIPLPPPMFAARTITDAAAARRAKLMLTGLKAALDDAEDRGDFTNAAMRMRDLTDFIGRCTTIAGDTAAYTDFAEGVDLSRYWLVPGILERGDRFMVIAGEGSGKSYLMRQFAMQLACGAHWMTGRYSTRGRVLLIDCENSKPEIMRHMRSLEPIADGYYANWRDNLHIVSEPAGLDLDGSRDAMRVESLLDQIRPDLLIIGPLYRIAGDDNGQGWERHARVIQRRLDEWRHRYGVALAMEAHAGKSRDESGQRALQVIGSSAWQRWPEMSLALRFDPETRGFLVGNARSGHRGERIFPTKLRRGDRSQGEWSWVGDWSETQAELLRLQSITEGELAVQAQVAAMTDDEEPF